MEKRNGHLKLIGAAIAGAIASWAFQSLIATAQQSGVSAGSPTYQVVSAGNGPYAWRLNTSTGDLQYCYIYQNKGVCDRTPVAK